MSDTRPSRREVLKAAACATSLAASMPVPSLGQRMERNVFVLVHPAWHGGWCWKKLVPLLRARGHDVFTPTLTGLGDRSHLARPDVGLDVHVSDVVALLTYEDLTNVVLVGHSSSGAVITGAADRSPERLAHVVYLDAFVPSDGQSVLDLLAFERRQILEQLAKAEGHGWLLPRFAPPPWETIVRDLWGVTDAGDVRWMLDRLVPTPLGHFTDPVKRTNPAAEKLPRTYVRCPGFPSATFDRHADMARRTAHWQFRELPTSHHPAITAPERLAALLLGITA
jgi:pimeloyl-ACP methyl ester carboxylesterase